MARIIDLKNGQVVQVVGLKPEPENGQLLAVKHTTSLLGPKVISWSGQSRYHYNPRAIVFSAFVFFVLAVFVQIFQENVITTIFFTMLGSVLLLNAKKKPETLNFEINPAGTVVDGKVLHYPEIKSFWIEYDPTLGIKELSLQLKKWYAPYIKIPIEGQDPVQLHFALLEFLPEIEHKDSIVEILSRKIGL